MSFGRSRHNRRRAGQYRIGMIAAIIVCVIMVFVLAGVLLNNRKNGIRLEGISLYEQGKYTDALLKLAEGEEVWAPFSDALEEDMRWYEGSCYLMQGDYVNARNIYERMLADSREPDRILTYQQIAAGLTAYMDNDYEQAIEGLTSYAGADCPALYLYLGSCYMELAKYDEMQQAFDAYRGLGLDSDFLHAELASYYMNLGDYGTAQTEVAAGLALAGGYTRELRWQEICCLERILDFNGAYEKMRAFAQDYTLDEKEQKEWNFLQTRYVETGSGAGEETNAESNVRVEIKE